jgi:hypothetical protein
MGERSGWERTPIIVYVDRQQRGWIIGRDSGVAHVVGDVFVQRECSVQ